MTSSGLSEQLHPWGVLATAIQGTGQRGEEEATSRAPDRELESSMEKPLRLLVIP